MTTLREKAPLIEAVSGPNAPLRARLELLFDWYVGMVAPDPGRLAYLYDPLAESLVVDGNPIRDLAAVRDIGALSRFLEKPDLLPVIDASLRHYEGFLVPHGTGLILDPVRLGEPASIAHNAFLILALQYWDVPARRVLLRALAESILHQQRKDGSYRVYFDDRKDDGVEFYPGEAMLALVEATRYTADPRFRASTERGLPWYQRRLAEGRVDPELLVFYANWQGQTCGLLCVDTEHEEVRREARAYLFSLHDRVHGSGFYRNIQAHPLGQSTVQVACALEGVSEAYAEALRIGDRDRIARYRGDATIALNHLAEAQCRDGATERETGGFGYSSHDRTQRIDVAGHVASGFMKCITYGLG